MNLSDKPPDVHTCPTAKPALLPVIAENIPEAMRRQRRWVCWSWEWTGRKWDKPPRQPDGCLASATNSKTWVSLDEALAAHWVGNCDGIGFVLGKDEETGVIFSGLDLDEVRDPTTGELVPWANWFISLLKTYSEVSPSQQGTKSFAIGSLPKGRRQDAERGIEMYDGGRYFTVTGHRLENWPAEVMDRSDVLREIHFHVFGEDGKAATKETCSSERDLALAALAGLSKHRAVGYQDWLGVGMALHAVNDDLLDAWDQWSRSCPDKYQSGVCAKKWASFRGKGLGLGSLVYWAKQDGWRFPSANVCGGTQQAARHIGDLEVEALLARIDAVGRGSKLLDDGYLMRGLARMSICDPWGFARARGRCGDHKVRLRDFDVAIEHLRQQIIKEMPAPPGVTGPYQATDKGIVWLRATHAGPNPVPVPLSNWCARIVEQTIHDDGAERRTVLTIEGKLHDGRALSRVEVATSEFNGMHWPVERWGTQAVVFAGLGIADHLRAAIQLLSGVPLTRTVYTHLGWREVDGRWVYLHAGGAIGKDGPASDVAVAVHRALENYELPPPPQATDRAAAVRATLRMLDLGHQRIMFPLISATYRAVLGSVDFTLHLSGDSGLYKSEVAALVQQHYGARMDARHLPGSWSSTGNSLEAVAFLAADAVFAVDDYVPTGAAGDIQRSRKELARLVRAQGNNSGRGRCRSDGTPQPSKPPRGLIVSTGEDAAAVRSVQARMLVLDVSPGDLGPPPPAHNPTLTACQKDGAAGLYAQALSAFVQWLAPRYREVRDRLPQERAELREKAIAERAGGHARTPAIVADLALGLKYFLNFAVEVGAITTQERGDLARRGWRALGNAAREHAKHVEVSEACGMFRRLLAAALANGRAHVAGPDGGEPDNPPAWGWRQVTVGTGQYRRTEWQPRGERVGWVDGPKLYLEPEASHAAAQELAGDQGEALSVSPRVLHKRLKERGWLVSWDSGRQRNTVRRSLEGVKDREVLHLRADALTHEQPSEPSAGVGDPPEPTGRQEVPEDGQADGSADGNGLCVENRPPKPSAKTGENQVSGRFGRSDTGGVRQSPPEMALPAGEADWGEV
jgi:hypothetical protein